MKKKGFTLRSKACKGFTLIELLTVVSIIGVLAALVLVSFTNSQKGARDTRRKSDLKQYQTALEQFANENDGVYPSRTTATGAFASSVLCTDLSLSTCAEDPRNGEDESFVYLYQTNGSDLGTVDATDYVLWAKLEKSTTDTYWVLCSNGVVGETETAIPPTAGSCPI